MNFLTPAFACRNAFSAIALGIVVICCLLPMAATAAPACVETKADGGSAESSAPTPIARGGIGGTGDLASGGIGGTGNLADGGIGGTGIIGTVTGFGSVCVNGFEVEYDQSTPTTHNGVKARTTELALGQVIAITAEHGGKGWVARDISILNLLEGPVTATDSENGAIRVMGVPVHADGATRLVGVDTLASVRPGALLRVAGFHNANGEVYATRIEAVNSLDENSAIGAMARTATGEATLDGLAVRIDARLAPASGEVLLRGKWDGRALVGTTAQPDPYTSFSAHVEHLVAEGLVTEGISKSLLRIGGLEVELTDKTRIGGAGMDKLAPGQRVIVSGQQTGRGRILAQRIEIGSLQPMHPESSGANRQGHGNATMPGVGDHAPMMERPVMPISPQPMPGMHMQRM